MQTVDKWIWGVSIMNADVYLTDTSPVKGPAGETGGGAWGGLTAVLRVSFFWLYLYCTFTCSSCTGSIFTWVYLYLGLRGILLLNWKYLHLTVAVLIPVLGHQGDLSNKLGVSLLSCICTCTCTCTWGGSYWYNGSFSNWLSLSDCNGKTLCDW